MAALLSGDAGPDRRHPGSRHTRVRCSGLAGTSAAAIAATLALPITVNAQRPVIDNEIRSDELPAGTIVVDPTLRHLGAVEFVLYGRTDVELHLFVESEDAIVRRVLWIQFEGFREGDDRTYDYSDDPTIARYRSSWHVNGRFYPPAGFRGRPGSDGDHALDLLHEHGLELDPHGAIRPGS